jgi:phosphatidylinositol glycan class H protein
MGIVSLFILLLRQNTYETLLVSEGFGIQVTSCGRFYFFSDQTRFIALHDILDIVIQEAFIGFEVRHVLLIVIAGEEKLQVVFPRLLPRLGVIEEVWRGARRCLCESSDDLPLTNGLVDKPTAVLTER